MYSINKIYFDKINTIQFINLSIIFFINRRKQINNLF
jgi:hypothetical protein